MDGQMDRSVLRAAWLQLKIQYDHQAAILKVTSLKNKNVSTHSHKHTKFETEIPKQTWVMLQKPCHVQSIQMKNPIWLPGSHFENDCHWKSIGFYPYTQVFCYWSLEWIFKAKLKLESGNQKIQYGHQVAILKLTLLKNNGLFCLWAQSTCTWNLKLKFQSKLWKPCCLQTDRQTDKMNPVYIPPSNFIGWGYNEKNFGQIYTHERHPIACP